MMLIIQILAHVNSIYSQYYIDLSFYKLFCSLSTFMPNCWYRRYRT